MFLNNYCCIPLNHISASQYLDFLHDQFRYYLFFISKLNGAQFLDIAPLFLLSSCFTIPSAPAPEMVIFHSQV